MLDKKDILEYYHSSFKNQRKIGIELELFCVESNTQKPLDYYGNEKSILAILRKFISNYGYEIKSMEEGVPYFFEIERGHEFISVEPGGQIEYSSSPETSVNHCKLRIDKFLKELFEIIQEMGEVSILSKGVLPGFVCNQIELVPKKRYKLLEDYLLERGRLGGEMMKCTGSLHINIDYKDEEEAMLMMRAIMSSSLIMSAYFSNSTHEINNKTYKNYRKKIWSETDAARCGLIYQFIREKCCLEDYIQLVLDTPLIYLKRNDDWIFVNGRITFMQFMSQGYNIHNAKMYDYIIHLNSMFHEARIKKYIEIRSMDAQPLNALLDPAFFWEALLSDRDKMNQAIELTSFATVNDFKRLYETLPIHGLDSMLSGRPVCNIARELIDLAGIPVKP